MKKTVNCLGLALLLAANTTFANNPFLLDFSGVYDCEGKDAHEGAYTGVVTMKKQAKHEMAVYSSYDFQLVVPGYGTYQGHAVAQGHFVAVHFALPMANGVYGGKEQDYGTGIAEFKLVNEKWQFKKFYYEPDYKGGNTGLETCTQR